MKKKLLINCLVLNGSRSGYRRIIKNLLLYAAFKGNELTEKFDLFFVFQRSGFQSLELDSDFLDDHRILNIRIINDFESKWTRGFAEQLMVPFLAIKYSCTHIIMPATFGLVFPIKTTITFVHTNTSFSLDKTLRGRGGVQQFIHNILIRITGYTSDVILFTTEQTRGEFQKYLGKSFPDLILGNGLMLSGQSPSAEFILNTGKIGEFILSVSQFYRLKNYDRLIRAFIKAKDGGKIGKLKLLIVGTVQESDFYDELLNLSRGRDDIYFFHDIRDEELNYLYSKCNAYCFYSLFEGYSLTPAEALLHKKHISISDIPTHKEVYGSTAMYADPLFIDSIASSIIEAVCKSRSTEPSYSSDFLQKFSFDGFVRRLISWID
jgi:glycosyltransferase involved in cell wall biosynthesis